jgi:hypothetical protein
MGFPITLAVHDSPSHHHQGPDLYSTFSCAKDSQLNLRYGDFHYHAIITLGATSLQGSHQKFSFHNISLAFTNQNRTAVPFISILFQPVSLDGGLLNYVYE